MTTTKTLIVPSNIPHDYSADVIGPVQAFLDNAAPGSTIQFQENGLYRMEKTPLIRKPLDIDMNGASWKCTVPEPYGHALVNTQAYRDNRERANVRFFGDWHGGSISNGTLIGCQPYLWNDERAYNPRFEAQHAIDIQGSQDIEFANMKFFKQRGDFVAIAQGLGGARPTDIYGHDFRGDGNGRQGISVSIGSDIRFESYSLKHMRRAVYDVELDTDAALVERVTFGGGTVDDVEIGPHILNFYSSSDSKLGNVGTVTIRNHYAVSGVVLMILADAGDATHKRGPYIIRNLRATEPFGTPGGGLFTFKHLRGLTVTGCSHPVKTGGVWPDGHMCGVKVLGDTVIDDVSGNTFAGGAELCTP